MSPVEFSAGSFLFISFRFIMLRRYEMKCYDGFMLIDTRRAARRTLATALDAPHPAGVAHR
ncbi:hypothetical protein [Micromonospora sp. CPCC 206061]|uniref:hypothetical protein n=1 Tax=Micromonospora sp. CPCC 206061 TaxID=3122410 RepID=UPI002FF15FC5